MNGWKRLGIVLTVTWLIGIGSAIAVYWEEIGPNRFDGYDVYTVNNQLGFGDMSSLHHMQRKDAPPYFVGIDVPLRHEPALSLPYTVEIIVGPSKAAGLREGFQIPYGALHNHSEPSAIVEAWISYESYIFYDKSEEQLAEIERLIGIAQEEGPEALARLKAAVSEKVAARDQEKLHTQLLVAAGAPTLPPLALLLLIGIFNWVRRGFRQQSDVQTAEGA